MKKHIRVLFVLPVLIMMTGAITGQNKKKKNNEDFIRETTGATDFGKTKALAYTPEIRKSMQKLYYDKFGMFVHFGPYAQLEGVWKG